MSCYGLRFSDLSLDRLRIRTGLVTRMQLSRRSPALRCGRQLTASTPGAGAS